jgi:hypothetical protein
MEDDVNDLERILQEGISNYAGVEPLAGLEERILARVRMTESRRGSMAGWWAAWALGVAALAVGGSAYLRMGRTQPPPGRIVSETKTATVREMPRQIEAINMAKRRGHSRRAALPKRPVFPTPSPLTTEERLMLAMMKRDPDGTAQVFDSLRKRGSEPLEIAPLVIPPLETSGGQ